MGSKGLIRIDRKMTNLNFVVSKWCPHDTHQLDACSVVHKHVIALKVAMFTSNKTSW